MGAGSEEEPSNHESDGSRQADACEDCLVDEFTGAMCHMRLDACYCLLHIAQPPFQIASVAVSPFMVSRLVRAAWLWHDILVSHQPAHTASFSHRSWERSR